MEIIQNCLKNLISFGSKSANSNNDTSSTAKKMEQIPSNWEKASFWMILPKPLQAYDRIRIKGVVKGEVKG